MASRHGHSKKKWSTDVTEHSNALDLKEDTFKGSPSKLHGH